MSISTLLLNLALIVKLAIGTALPAGFVVTSEDAAINGTYLTPVETHPGYNNIVLSDKPFEFYVESALRYFFQNVSSPTGSSEYTLTERDNELVTTPTHSYSVGFDGWSHLVVNGTSDNIYACSKSSSGAGSDEYGVYIYDSNPPTNCTSIIITWFGL